MTHEQQIAALYASAPVRAASTAIDTIVPSVVQQTLALSRLPSPTFDEAAKAEFVRAVMVDLGLRDVHIDAVGNAIGCRPGRQRDGLVVLAAHIDTVFSTSTQLTGHEQQGVLRGPSVGDNSLGVAAMLGLVEVLDRAGLATNHDLLIVADVGEEGLGDLRGMREVMRTHGQQTRAVLAIEGHTLGRVTHRAVGSRRLKLTVTGPGGHSWGDFGRPNAIHVLAHVIGQLTHMPVAQSPRGSFNVGRIEGGVSINTIAPSATCELDIRSEDQADLERLVAWVESVVARRLPREVAVVLTTIGDRPAGAQPATAPIVSLCCAALRAIGIEPTLEASSTDANVPINLGIPAVCLGITRGAGAHRLDEHVEIAPIANGLRQLLLTTLALAGTPDQ
jgi:acetylornithine deacetylase/succinyl-diaminopimelate desuccinylase-like protein